MSTDKAVNGRPLPARLAQVKSQRELARGLAEEVVKILRQNPANANSHEYGRLESAIQLFAHAIKEPG